MQWNISDKSRTKTDISGSRAALVALSRSWIPLTLMKLLHPVSGFIRACRSLCDKPIETFVNGYPKLKTFVLRFKRIAKMRKTGVFDVRNDRSGLL
jgi:hypothetical protein